LGVCALLYFPRVVGVKGAAEAAKNAAIRISRVSWGLKVATNLKKFLIGIFPAFRGG
jgi:hypothetical protein